MTDRVADPREFRQYSREEGDPVREFYRANHSQQTLGFVLQKKAEYLPLRRARMTVWEALERLDRAMRLSPFDQHMFWHLTICGGASFVAHRYDESAGWLGKALRLNPGFNGARRMQIAALVRTGELAEARALAEQLLIDCPDFSVEEFGRWSPMQRPHLDDLLSALRQAGLPG